MDQANLLKRRQEVVDYHKLLEKTRGSGWSMADPGSEEREKKGELNLSDRPVAIHDDDQIYFVGECFVKVKAALEAFLAKTVAEPETDFLGSGLPYQAIIVKAVKRLLERSTEYMCIDDHLWNRIGAGLQGAWIQCCMTNLQ